MAEPRTTIARLTSSIRFLPNMSPRRPLIGVITAAARSVAVTAHEVSAGVEFNRCGNCGMMGTTSVCIKATTIPHSPRTVSTGPEDA